MKDCCKLLYERAKETHDKSWKRATVQSGWFKVSIDKHYVTVQFILTWETSYDFIWDYTC